MMGGTLSFSQKGEKEGTVFPSIPKRRAGALRLVLRPDEIGP